MYKALEIIVTGKIQGVGFRPFIYSLAQKYNLTGTVQNNVDRVTIIAEGEESDLQSMLDEIKRKPPNLAKINDMLINQVPNGNYKEFSIVGSVVKGDSLPWIAADAAICEKCLEEITDNANRRFHYPFTNCTQCGPRYTIIKNLPYDRPQTSMHEFPMCPACKEEYQDQSNRRHHAQPICCPECGPTITLQNHRGEIVAQNNKAINNVGRLIKQGNIVAIKGLGGYHLACNAYNWCVVELLRQKKKRPQKPFAIMVKSLQVAKKICFVNDREEEILTSPEMPIVVLKRRKECGLPENLSPGLSTLGVMLPYTPLHHLIIEESDLDCLVMTSANPSGFPIPYTDEFHEHLREMSVYFLTHNRKIYQPIDDSVVQCYENKYLFLRRARGYVPEPIQTKANVDRILAYGGNQKNTFAIGKRNQIMMSPHIGDLESEEMKDSFLKQLQHFKEWMGVEEEYIAIDKHPLYEANAMVNFTDKKKVFVQHHHAHHVSCMVDNGLEEPCFGIILDGTGYGDDGHIWGFEFLYGNAQSFKRLGHLQYTPLPGGEKAVREPWRNAVGMLLHYWPHDGKEIAIKLFPEKSKEIELIEKMIANQINTPLAGTCGRLFDAVSAILGVCFISTYEGEAAIKLSDYMNLQYDEILDEIYDYQIKMDDNQQQQLLDLSQMIEQILQERFSHEPLIKMIRKFHHTILASIVEMLLTLVKNNPDFHKKVVLSGGSFQNVFLAAKLQKRLQDEGFTVYTHQQVPCHDGGLSLGQIVIASYLKD
ncbi:carbamoyltransferase HypF [Neobacillus sp. D3-1R]|uniref:carbamoyltransferase HypF n=1 Tax=Neobacillus sp. D3-1R TaxID=3445778 RepID=UPI003F9EEFBE